MAEQHLFSGAPSEGVRAGLQHPGLTGSRLGRFLVAVGGLDAGNEAIQAFDRAALDYCRKLRFQPALANDEPVAARIDWVVEFRI